MNSISIFVIILICNELLAAPMEKDLQGKDELYVGDSLPNTIFNYYRHLYIIYLFHITIIL